MKAILAILIFAGLVAGVFYFTGGPTKGEPNAAWDGHRWSCPRGYDVYASQRELEAGNEFVHCVK